MSVFVLGHRGYRHDRFPEKYPGAAHENTLRAFEYALTHCWGFETDIILSKQGTPYLTHDTLFTDRVYYELKVHLDEASKKVAGNRFIYQMDDSEIVQLKMVDGQSFTRMADMFTLAANYPGRMINIELKGPHTNDIAVAAVEQAIAKDQVTADQIVFSGFYLPGLRQLRDKIGDRFKIGALLSLNTQTRTFMFPDFPNAPQDAYYTPFILEQGVMQNEDLRAINPDYFNLEYKTLSDAGLEAIDKFNPNAKIMLWPAGEPHPDDDFYILDIIKKFAPTGKIHAVMSDFPEILQNALFKENLAVAPPKPLS